MTGGESNHLRVNLIMTSHVTQVIVQRVGGEGVLKMEMGDGRGQRANIPNTHEVLLQSGMMPPGVAFEDADAMISCVPALLRVRPCVSACVPALLRYAMRVDTCIVASGI